MIVENSIKDFYKREYAKHGNSPRALGWGSKRSQNVRFNEITSFIDINKKGLRILDVGCGFADYACYLDWYMAMRNIENTIYYVGIDFVEEMVMTAQNNLNNAYLRNIPYAYIFPFDTLTMRRFLLDTPWFDYVVASGIFAFSSYISMSKIVEDMVAISKERVIFNCLKEGYEGKKISDIDEHEFYADPATVLLQYGEFGDVTITSNYLPNDFTVCIEVQR